MRQPFAAAPIYRFKRESDPGGLSPPGGHRGLVRSADRPIPRPRPPLHDCHQQPEAGSAPCGQKSFHRPPSGGERMTRWRRSTRCRTTPPLGSLSGRHRNLRTGVALRDCSGSRRSDTLGHMNRASEPFGVRSRAADRNPRVGQAFRMLLLPALLAVVLTLSACDEMVEPPPEGGGSSSSGWKLHARPRTRGRVPRAGSRP